MKPAAGPSASVRPEWLYQVVNRLQPITSATVSVPARSSDSVFDDLPPESPLEHQIKDVLMAQAAADARIVAARLGARSDVRQHGALIDVGALSGTDLESVRLHAAVEHAKTLLRHDLTIHWTVEALARRVGYNRTGLEVGFRRITSHTIHQYLSATRIEVAQHLLRTTAWRVEEVARAVGYRSKVSLYDHFRRSVAVTPDQYRLRWTHQAPSPELRRWLLCPPPPFP